MASFIAFLKAFPALVSLVTRLVDTFELLAMEARQERLDKNLKEGIEDAKSTHNMRKLEELWGKKFNN